MCRSGLLLTCAAVVLAACGGGDADDSSASVAATDSPSVAATTAPASTPQSEPSSDYTPVEETATTSVESAVPATTSAVEPAGDADVPVVDFSAVDPLIDDLVERYRLDGAALVIVHRDFGIVDERFWGVFDADRVSLIASSSKMVAASVLMALDDAGQLDVDAPIADVLSYAADHPDITAAQLLSNSSGLPGLMATQRYPDYLCAFSHESSLQECATAILTTPDDDGDVAQPDTRFDYGGVQWQIAGAVAEAASRLSWAELVDQLIVQPCGLTDFAFNNHFSQVTTAGFSYPPGFDNNPDVLVATANPNIEGGAYSTTTDYAALMLMHLRGGVCGDTQVLSQEALDMMHSDRVAAVYDGNAGDAMTGYGMGWWVDRMSGTISDPGAFGSVPILDLDDGYGMLLMTESNSGLATSFAEKLRPLIDDAFAAALG
ncbi:MAG: serine hydrolase [Actinomycetota bacterium]|nr:serine hydrolase [Actinomycetota bacterium]MDA3006610.1 serine hydrolase [Actinomycetota bacterium]MDA3033998.1 serine hydrolase [Actinomycetota bacterium]